MTAQTQSGSTVRLAWKAGAPRRYGIFFLCQTSLVQTFRTHYPHTFTFSGNRAILFDEVEPVPATELRSCIAHALTYHQRAGRPRLRSRPVGSDKSNRHLR